jgi:hypothetical protein
MPLQKTQKFNFAKFVFRQNFDVFGNKIMMENTNTTKEISVKIYKYYHRFLDINSIMKNTKQFKIIKLCLFFEFFSYIGNIAISLYKEKQKQKEENKFNLIKEDININLYSITDKKNLIEKKLQEKNYIYFGPYKFQIENFFDRKDICNLSFNLLSISYLAKYINLINPFVFKKILFGSIGLKSLCLILNEKFENFFQEKFNIRNFNIFGETSFLSKALITFSLFDFMDKLFLNKNITWKFLKFSRKPILFLLPFFIIGKISCFLSLLTVDSIK